jgi:hypothetical protein
VAELIPPMKGEREKVKGERENPILKSRGSNSLVLKTFWHMVFLISPSL